MIHKTAPDRVDLVVLHFDQDAAPCRHRKNQQINFKDVGSLDLSQVIDLPADAGCSHVFPLRRELTEPPGTSVSLLFKNWIRYLRTFIVVDDIDPNRRDEREGIEGTLDLLKYPWKLSASYHSRLKLRAVHSWESLCFKRLHAKRDPLLTACLDVFEATLPGSDALRLLAWNWALNHASASSRTSQFGDFLAALNRAEALDAAIKIWVDAKESIAATLVPAFLLSLDAFQEREDKKRRSGQVPADFFLKADLFGSAVRLAFEVREERKSPKFERDVRRWTHLLAHHLNCLVRYIDTPAIHAFMIHVGCRKTIYLHKQLKTADNCYYLCHELGHYLLNHVPNSSYGLDASCLLDGEHDSFSRQELEADYFAEAIVSILMALYPETACWLTKSPPREKIIRLFHYRSATRPGTPTSGPRHLEARNTQS